MSGRFWEGQSVVSYVSGSSGRLNLLYLRVWKALGGSTRRISRVRKALGGSICRILRVLEGSRKPKLLYFTCLEGSGKLNLSYVTCPEGSGRLNLTYFTCPGRFWEAQSVVFDVCWKALGGSICRILRVWKHKMSINSCLLVGFGMEGSGRLNLLYLTCLEG